MNQDLPSPQSPTGRVIQPPQQSTGREYPGRPILGVAGLIFEGRSALLIKRGKEPGLGRWSIPGGAVRIGETLTRALVREMAEEVALEVEVGPLVEVIERIFPDADGRVLYHYVVLDYLCFSGSGRPRPGSDAAEVRYVPQDEWPAYGLPSITLRVLNQGLALAENLKNGKGPKD